MKKLFASLMAATMVAGMSVSAFAYTDDNFDKNPEKVNDANEVTVIGDTEDDYGFASERPASGNNSVVYGGDSIYFPIVVNVEEVEDFDETDTYSTGYYYATKASEVEDLKVSVKESIGKGTIKSVEIVREKASKFIGGTESKKIYGIKVKLNDYFKTEESELEFDLILKERGKEQLKVEDIYYVLGQDDDNSRLKGEFHKVNGNYTYFDANGKIEELAAGTADGSGNVAWTDAAKTTTYLTVDANGKVTLDATNGKKVVFAKDVKDGYGFGYDAKFKENSGLLELTVGEDTKAVTLDEADKDYFGIASDENNKIEELYMETADGEMIVEGLLEEQDALFLGFETDPTDFQKDVMMENDKADVKTMNWVARPTFDFKMDVTVPVDEDEDNFLYEEIDGKLVEVEAELNKDGDALEFKTKTLGKYLLSDMELDAVEAEEAAKDEDEKAEEATETEDGKKANAETGASLVAVATAIALF